MLKDRNVYHNNGRTRELEGLFVRLMMIFMSEIIPLFYMTIDRPANYVFQVQPHRLY
jgi:hypothetical protein